MLTITNMLTKIVKWLIVQYIQNKFSAMLRNEPTSDKRAMAFIEEYTVVILNKLSEDIQCVINDLKGLLFAFLLIGFAGFILTLWFFGVAWNHANRSLILATAIFLLLSIGIYLLKRCNRKPSLQFASSFPKSTA